MKYMMLIAGDEDVWAGPTPEEGKRLYDEVSRWWGEHAEAGRIIGLTSSVGADPRSFWAAYGATKAAFDNLLQSYAAEVEKLSPLRVAIVDPGATRTDMRARAYPGEKPDSVKPPEVVADPSSQMR